LFERLERALQGPLVLLVAVDGDDVEQAEQMHGMREFEQIRQRYEPDSPRHVGDGEHRIEMPDVVGRDDERALAGHAGQALDVDLRQDERDGLEGHDDEPLQQTFC
jgi:hypothetical protein